MFFVSPVSSFGTLLAEIYGQSLLIAISQEAASQEKTGETKNIYYFLKPHIEQNQFFLKNKNGIRSNFKKNKEKFPKCFLK
ncbi:MAG: hypothetical protein US70_C0004G0025 [Parcubacteria group bacterium GW2011_GWD2_38_11]|nr:MAG: hypothetical protein US70_C0004G0025 [Parcubacteria group bacterium GW2011_GWD2_38_11]